MPRKTRICIITGVIVMLGSVALTMGVNVVMITMAMGNLDPSNANSMLGVTTWLARAFQLSTIGFGIAAIALVFTLITWAWWFVGPTKTPEQESLSPSGE